MIVGGSDWGGSRLETAQTCKQKYYNRYERQFDGYEGPPGIIKLEDPPAPAKGTLIHVALQHYYKRMIEDPTGDARTHILEGIWHMQQSMSKFNIPEENKPLLMDECMAAVDQYFQHYNGTSDLKPLAVEQPVQFKIPTANGGTLVHTGIVDLVTEWHGTPFVVDHKTTSLTFDALYRSYTFSLSFKGYCLAVAELTGKKQVGVLVNAIRFRKNKALEVEFEREPIMFTDDELADFGPTVISIRREIDMCRETGFWPKSSKQCSQPWGTCEYFQLCKFDDPAMVRALYKPAKRPEVTDEPASV